MVSIQRVNKYFIIFMQVIGFLQTARPSDISESLVVLIKNTYISINHLFPGMIHMIMIFYNQLSNRNNFITIRLQFGQDTW